jgi:hypothetical protein
MIDHHHQDSPMKDAEFVELLLKLPKLNTEQLHKVRTRIDALLTMKGEAASSTQSSSDQSASIDLSDDWLLDGVLFELEKRKLHTVPKSILVKMPAFKAYKKSAHLVHDFFAQRIKEQSRTGLIALGRVAAKAHARYVSSFTEVSLDSLLRNIAQVPRAIERAFPGYVSAGLLDLLINMEDNEYERIAAPASRRRLKTL